MRLAGSIGRLAIAAGASALFLSLPSLSLPTVAAPAASALAAPAPPPAAVPTQSDGGPVALQITTLRPRVPTATSELIVAGTLVNRGKTTLHQLSIAVRRGGTITSRSELAAAAQGMPAVEQPDVDGAQPVAGDLPPGGRLPFTFTDPLAALLLGSGSAKGVYPLRIEARTAADGPVGEVSTFLPWFPDKIIAPTRLAWVWPLVDQPRRTPTGLFTDDVLAGELGRGGRLRALLDAAVAALAPQPLTEVQAPTDTRPTPPAKLPAVAVPVTVALDPALVDAVTAMSRGYQVAAVAGSARPGRGVDAARAWLASLRQLLTSDPVLPLPYADPDVSATVRAGLGRDVTAAVSRGRDLMLAELGPAVRLQPTALPPGGAVSADALAALVTAPVAPARSLLVGEAAMPSPPELTYTPSGRGTVATPVGRLPVAIGDDTLAAILAAGSTADGPRLAEQRFLAETAMITAEQDVSRDIVVIAPRRWAVDPAFAGAVLADTGRVPWLRPTTVADVLATAPPSGVRRELSYPAAAQRAELPTSYLARVAALAESRATFSAILAQPALADPVQVGELRAESAAWRGQPRAGEALLGTATDYLGGLQAGVGIASSGTVTLTSARGTVPITVTNALTSAVRVRVTVEARDRVRLSGGDTMVQTVLPRSRQTVKIPVEAQASGKFPVSVQLLTPSGAPIGAPVTLLLNVTAFGRVALAITGTAFGVLLVAVGVRISRRALRSRARPPGPTAPAADGDPVVAGGRT